MRLFREVELDSLRRHADAGTPGPYSGAGPQSDAGFWMNGAAQNG